MSTIALLIRPALFTAGVCGASFCGSAIVQHERRLNYTKRWRDLKSHLTIRTNQASTSLREKIISWRRGPWFPGEKIAGCVIIANVVVLASWRIPALRPVMEKYFLCRVNPKKIPLSPMILSCFSHINPLHFAFNMYALYSFSNFATSLLGPEQLVGLYFSAGAVSSFTSIGCRLIRKEYMPSLGASGALLGVVSYICVARPETELLLFFMPIAAGHAIKGLLLLDTAGIIARWRFMDHAAHLGGSLFGIWYALHGEKLFAKHKSEIVKRWQKLKE